MDWAAFVIQWLHILFGIFWFGGALFSNFVLGPFLVTLPKEQLRTLLVPLAERADRVVVPVAIVAITLGFVRGTVFGPVRNFDVLFGTSFGITWLVALVVAVATLAWGMRNARGVLRRARAGEDVTAVTGSAVRDLGLELLGFAVILTAMLLMRFGL